MKNFSRIYSLILSGLLIIICGASCQKDDGNTNNNTLTLPMQMVMFIEQLLLVHKHG